DGANAVEIEELHLFAAPPQISRIAPVPAAVDGVIARALAKEKRDRHPDVGAFLDDLTEAVSGRDAPAPARPTAVPGIGLLVELPVGASALGEAEDRVLAIVDEVIARLELRVAVETAYMLLAVAPLPEGAAAQERLRMELIAGAL